MTRFESERDGEPPEANEADWLESHLEADRKVADEPVPTSLGDRLDEADEADLLESEVGTRDPIDDLEGEIPLEAPEADVLEQRLPPTNVAEEGEDRR